MKTKKAFSLIELVIVLIIVGLLASFAIPSYQKFRSKGSVLAVQSALTSISLKMNRCYFNQLENYRPSGNNQNQCNFDYSSINDNDELKKFILNNNYQGNYEINLVDVKKNEYLVEAKLTDNSQDNNCAKLTIDQDYEKKSLDSKDNQTSDCW